MMNRVLDRKLQIQDRRLLKQSPEIDNLQKLLARQLRQAVEIGLKRFAIPGGDIRRVADGIRPAAVRIVELTSGDRVHKEVLRRDYVPSQFQRALRYRSEEHT